MISVYFVLKKMVISYYNVNSFVIKNAIQTIDTVFKHLMSFWFVLGGVLYSKRKQQINRLECPKKAVRNTLDFLLVYHIFVFYILPY